MSRQHRRPRARRSSPPTDRKTTETERIERLQRWRDLRRHERMAFDSDQLKAAALKLIDRIDHASAEYEDLSDRQIGTADQRQRLAWLECLDGLLGFLGQLDCGPTRLEHVLRMRIALHEIDEKSLLHRALQVEQRRKADSDQKRMAKAYIAVAVWAHMEADNLTVDAAAELVSKAYPDIDRLILRYATIGDIAGSRPVKITASGRVRKIYEEVVRAVGRSKPDSLNYDSMVSIYRDLTGGSVVKLPACSTPDRREALVALAREAVVYAGFKSG